MGDPQYRGQAWRDVTVHVLERDGWVCQLCGAPIPRHARARDPRRGVADHVVAVSAGGAWHDPANLRAAHYGCNAARANQGRHRISYPVRRAW